MSTIPRPAGRPEHGPGTDDALRGGVAACFFIIGAVCTLTGLTGEAAWPATAAVLAAAPLVGAHTYATSTVLIRRCP
ncbi:hypothetical protein [Actinomadura sp. SCN-SB]|uniref:hypothetical protein n=1 Tax=Actinomadura sp. SCN-SB TaxID=3373092 RepID=UPI00375179C8